MEFGVRKGWSSDVGNGSSESQLVSRFVETKTKVDGLNESCSFGGGGTVEIGVDTTDIPLNNVVNFIFAK